MEGHTGLVAGRMVLAGKADSRIGSGQASRSSYSALVDRRLDPHRSVLAGGMRVVRHLVFGMPLLVLVAIVRRLGCG